MGELVQGVVDRGQRDSEAQAGCLFIQAFGGDVPVFAFEQHAGQFHPLAGGAQTHFPQTLDRLAVIAHGLGHKFPFRKAATRGRQTLLQS